MSKDLSKDELIELIKYVDQRLVKVERDIEKLRSITQGLQPIGPIPPHARAKAVPQELLDAAKKILIDHKTPRYGADGNRTDISKESL